MAYTVDGLIEKMTSSLPESYIIKSQDDALIKAAFTTEELGEVVKAIARNDRKDVVRECADTIVGLLQIMSYYNEEGAAGVTSAFDETIGKLRARKMENNKKGL
jgi:NTP pyrophosphatase (non-canonical NTP hydrolase)